MLPAQDRVTAAAFTEPTRLPPNLAGSCQMASSTTQPLREGNTWYLPSRTGRRILRRWDPAEQRFSYTDAGRRFSSRRQIE